MSDEHYPGEADEAAADEASTCNSKPIIFDPVALDIIKRADLEPEDQHGLLTDITHALAQREREVWEEAAKHIELMYNESSTYSLMIDQHITYCRQKAQPPTPGRSER